MPVRRLTEARFNFDLCFDEFRANRIVLLSWSQIAYRFISAISLNTVLGIYTISALCDLIKHQSCEMKPIAATAASVALFLSGAHHSWISEIGSKTTLCFRHRLQAPRSHYDIGYVLRTWKERAGGGRAPLSTIDWKWFGVRAIKCSVAWLER